MKQLCSVMLIERPNEEINGNLTVIILGEKRMQQRQQQQQQNKEHPSFKPPCPSLVGPPCCQSYCIF